MKRNNKASITKDFDPESSEWHEKKAKADKRRKPFNKGKREPDSPANDYSNTEEN
jgi:hypothetical protein